MSLKSLAKQVLLRTSDDVLAPKGQQSCRNSVPEDTDMDEDDLWDAFEERAAIIEYDGGYPRDEAERMARHLIWQDRSTRS